MGPYEFVAFLKGTDIRDVKHEILMLKKDQYGSLSNILAGDDIPDWNDDIEDEPQDSHQSPQSDELDYGDEWAPLDSNPQALAIIKNRKILEAPFIPDDWKLFYDNKSGRIVLPWIRDGKMVYYQLRTMMKSHPCKYLFPKGLTKDIFGYDNIDDEFSYIFYCEGVFDAIFVKNCVAVGGISLTQHQSEIMAPYDHTHELVFFPDNQWMDEAAMRASLKIVSQGKKIFIWPRNITYKDVNEYIVKTGENPFATPEFMAQNIFKGPKALLKLKFKK
jgi:hypothetical protein